MESYFCTQNRNCSNHEIFGTVAGFGRTSDTIQTPELPVIYQVLHALPLLPCR